MKTITFVGGKSDDYVDEENTGSNSGLIRNLSALHCQIFPCCVEEASATANGVHTTITFEKRYNIYNTHYLGQGSKSCTGNDGPRTISEKAVEFWE